jgi:hypothetical protein
MQLGVGYPSLPTHRPRRQLSDALAFILPGPQRQK